MQVYLHQGLDPDRIPNFAKLRSRLEAGDFRSAESRKVGDNLFRARLDRRARVLFSFARYAGETCILLLEHIPNHAYEKSRFLRLGETVEKVDEASLPVPEPDSEEKTNLAYVPEEKSRGRGSFHVLDKVIFLDDAQHEAFGLPPPFILIGPAGSGKTVVVLEKLKEAVGDVLYVTRSPHLADRSREAYCGLNYGNDDQEASFLSYAEFLETIRVPPTREVSFAEFSDWFSRHRQATGLKDAWRAFEEFGGVITGNATDSPYLSLENYEELGVRRSIYPPEDRGRVHALFLKYLSHLQESGRHDTNLLSHEYLSLVEPSWDFVVIDEAQDFTNVQLELVLKSLRDPRGFVLCGDANQIVHPNFFSWSSLKTFLYFRRDGHPGTGSTGRNGPPAESGEQGRFQNSEKMVRVLTTNYRNSRQVTETANRILRLKHARFGSVDRESNHLVTSHSGDEGGVLLLPDTPEVTREIDGKTNRSARHAVVVLHPEQKDGARERFRTPLVFTIQEAKGLEYDHVILYGLVSGDADRFREIARGVEPGQVQAETALEELRYARARDRGDKSLEMYKFHVNALYVAVTRAVRTVYLVEPEPGHRLFDLLGIFQFSGELDLEDERSSLAEWRREARKLERQGKTEQAADIRERLLGVRAVPWEPLDRAALDELTDRVFRGDADRKAMLLLYEYALLAHDEARLNLLAAAGFRPALGPAEAGMRKLVNNRFPVYSIKHARGVRTLVEKYGPDHRDPFNCTPLMLAARFGHEEAVEMLAEEMGAGTAPVNAAGLTAFQILLQEVFLDERRARRGFGRMYRRLCPADISVMVQGRLVKLNDRKAEFLFFNLFLALFGTRMRDKAIRRSIGLRAADLEEVLGRLPDSEVPAYRKRRPYISSVLARNEVDRDLPANRRIFRRTERGVYILNPEMGVRVGGEWVRIYDLLEPEVLLVKRGRPDLGPEIDEMLRDHRKLVRRKVVQCLSHGADLSLKPWAIPDANSGESLQVNSTASKP